MMLDLLFVTILVAMVATGAWRGAVTSGSGLVCLLSGYAGAILAASNASNWTARTLVVSPLVAPAVAGTLGFVLAWLVASCLAGVLIAWDRSRVEEQGRSRIDRAIGGFFGLARGGLIVVLLAILASWLDAARDLGAVDGLAALPDAERSAVARASGSLVEGAVGSALADAGPAGELAARLAARPGRALASVQTILDDQRLEALFDDRLFWTLIQNDSIDYAMNRNTVQSIVHDPELRGRFVDLGLVEEGAREDSEVFEQRMGEVLAELAPRVQRLQHDPEMKELASDPEIIDLVTRGDTLALMTHPKIQRIVSRISENP